ncbi:unnamed protein product [Mortierella alpina]
MSIIAGLNRMEESAKELSAFIDNVLVATGYDKMNLLCHSQGAAVSRYYMRFLEGAAKVDKMAAFAPVNYGTALHDLVPLFRSLGIYDRAVNLVNCVYLSRTQFPEDSPFLQNLNAGSNTLPGVQYMFIASKTDDQIIPYSNCFLRDDNPLVKNIILQNLCPTDDWGHITQMFDPNVFLLADGFFSNVTNTVDCSTLED